MIKRLVIVLVLVLVSCSDLGNLRNQRDYLLSTIRSKKIKNEHDIEYVKMLRDELRILDIKISRKESGR